MCFRYEGYWYNDTLHGPTKYKAGKKYGQVFANNAYFSAIYPMYTENKFGEVLRVFFQEFEVSERLTKDGALDKVGQNSKFEKEVQNKELIFR